MDAAIPSAAGLFGRGRSTLRLGVASGDSLQTREGNAITCQDSPDRVRAPLPEVRVVLRRSAVVTVAFDHNHKIRVIAKDPQEFWSSSFERASLGRTGDVFVQVKVHIMGHPREAVIDLIRCG